MEKERQLIMYVNRNEEIEREKCWLRVSRGGCDGGDRCQF